jgi:nucleoside-diphosphate-sugar epimerase
MEAVIHLGARAAFEEYRLLESTIVHGSESLILAAQRAGVRDFVYASSMLVYGDESAPIDAATAPRPQLAYGRAKLETERRLSTIADRSGMRLVSIRLPHVYGARDLFFSRISRGLTLIPGRDDNLYSRLHVRDAARVLIAAAETPIRGCWPVGDRRAATWREFFSVVRSYYPRFQFVLLPKTIALLGTRLLRPAQLLRRRPTILTSGSVIAWNLNLAIEPDALWSQLGLEPEYPTMDEGVAAALDECVAFRWLHPFDDKRDW